MKQMIIQNVHGYIYMLEIVIRLKKYQSKDYLLIHKINTV